MTARGSSGFASALAVAIIAVLMTVTVFAAAVAGVLVAQRRAESAADLAALAGATAGRQGTSACAQARRVASANGARLDACRVRGATLLVEVSRTARGWLGAGVVVHATARAGPR